MRRKVFKIGSNFLEYRVLKLIGQGKFTDIYCVRSDKDDKTYALKIESFDVPHQRLRGESVILESVNYQNLYFPKVFRTGQTEHYFYVVLEILGPSLSQLRLILSEKKIQLSTTLRLAIEMLRCIEQLHIRGFIHRDVKPSNFLLRPSRSQPLSFIDLGISRKYSDGSAHMIERENTSFVGTAKYASINAHQNHDLSRRDDLYSWFYSILEILTGSLPWANKTTKADIYQAKKDFDPLVICVDLPSQIPSIYQYIAGLAFSSDPDYKLLTSYLVAAFEENHFKWTDPYEWELLPPNKLRSISSIDLTPPIGDKPLVPTVPAYKDPANIENEKKSCCSVF